MLIKMPLHSLSSLHGYSNTYWLHRLRLQRFHHENKQKSCYGLLEDTAVIKTNTLILTACTSGFSKGSLALCSMNRWRQSKNNSSTEDPKFYVMLLHVAPWRWRQHSLTKCKYHQRVTFQKTRIFIGVTVINWNLAILLIFLPRYLIIPYFITFHSAQIYSTIEVKRWWHRIGRSLL